MHFITLKISSKTADRIGDVDTWRYHSFSEVLGCNTNRNDCFVMTGGSGPRHLSHVFVVVTVTYCMDKDKTWTVRLTTICTWMD